MRSTILVVDRDRALQNLLKVLLTRAGFEVELAADGREALERLNGDGHHYAAIMLDLILPEVNGVDILDQLQKEHPALLPRTILLTSASSEALERVDTSRIHSVIRKPFDIQEVMDITAACASQD
jgi:two-component system response regulator ResD